MRAMAGDGQDMFRIVVVKKKKKANPDYVQGGTAPYWIYLDETYEESYGPYNAIGTARAQLTRQCLDYYKRPLPDVVGGRVEQAETKWRTVK